MAKNETATDSFRYLVDPGNGVESASTVRVTIIGANDAPVARADAISVSEDGPENKKPYDIDVLANDDDVDTDDDHTSLHVVEAHSASGADVQFSRLAGAGLGYAPAGHFEYLAVGGTAIDTITYTVEDRHGAHATATVDVTVTGVNDRPTAVGDDASTNEDAATIIAVLANDTDPDRTDRLQVTAINDELIAPGGRVTLASGASVTMDATGALAYDPRGHFDFLAVGEEFPRDDTESETFKYRIADGHGGTAAASVRVRIEGRNDAPIAVADLAAVGEDEAPIIIDVLANDDDIDSDDDRSSLRIISAQSVAGAEVQFSGLPGATLGYAPAGRFEYLAVGETAIDTITYTVEDRHGARAISTVRVTVQGANDAPTANDDHVSIDEDSLLELPLLANDTDPDRSDRLQVTSINGESIAPGGRVTLVSGAVVAMDAAGAHLRPTRAL